MNNQNKLFNSIIRVTTVRWQQVLENLRTMKWQFIKLSYLVYHSVTKERAIAAHLLSKSVYRMGKKSGWLHVSIYMKYAASSLQVAYAGDSVGVQPFPISLNRSGFPRIIPAFHRKMIRVRDDRADQLVKFYLSLFSVTKVILLAPKISRKLFKSIVTPQSEEVEESTTGLCELLQEKLPSLLRRYMPWISTIPLKQGMTWDPSWKTLPSYGSPGAKLAEVVKTPFYYFVLELRTFATNLRFIHMKGEQMSPLALWPKRIRYAGDRKNNQWTSIDVDACENSFAPTLPAIPEEHRHLFSFGRLAFSIEGRAKRRVFAIGNYVNQRLLRPVHDWLMDVLARLPSDGTFAQYKPLARLRGESVCYSYDLSAATDRLPLRVLFYVFAALFGRDFASSVVNSTLACHTFDVPFCRNRRKGVKAGTQNMVSFVVGQPLGFYGSWPLFALSHHVLVWLSAQEVYPNRKFMKYALLGDDLLIADQDVALTYRSFMDRLGVEISEVKSLVSHKGAAEFAKRFFVRNLTKDLSPISLKLAMVSHNPLGIYAIKGMYPEVPLKVLLRLAGAGYKVLAKPPSCLSRKFRRVYMMCMKTTLPPELWIGGGMPVNPYLMANIVSDLFERLKPRDLIIPPVLETLPSPQYQSHFFCEVTLIRSNMVKWVRYLGWYHNLMIRMYQGESILVIFRELLKPPIVMHDWRLTRSDPELVKFGHFWKLHDYVLAKGADWRPLCLPLPRDITVTEQECSELSMIESDKLMKGGPE